ASMLDVAGHERFDVSSLHTIGVAYEFSPRLRARALERFGDLFINMYGLTEAQLFCTRPGEFAGDPSSTGKPMGLMRVRIVDDEPDERWGEAVVAFVVAGPDGAGEDALRAHCRERLAGFKNPKRFVFLDELPKNPTGKVERGTLRRLAESSAA